VRFDKIADIVRQERPDVLEIHSPYLAAFGALRTPARAFGVRTFQWHSDFIDTYAGVLGTHLARARAPSLLGRALPPATRPLWSVVRAISRRCDATLVAASWQVDKLERHGVPRVVRVPFGIERDVFRPDARSFEGRRELLALAGRDVRSDAAVVVGLGRFAIEKRWDVVLDAFRVLRARGKDAVLVLYGDGPERARMQERAGGSPDVVFPGFLSDRASLARALASADLLVHGCPFETFGLSIAEAMASGLPVVVPDQGGAAEMHAEGAGARYRAGDPEACAEAVSMMLEQIAGDPGAAREAAVRATRRLPSVREQFESQVRLYAELLARRRHGDR
jgi:alpha-1,6-mannosyltransferase